MPPPNVSHIDEDFCDPIRPPVMGFLAETFVTGVVARLNRPGWSVPEGFLRDSAATQKARTAAVMKCAGRGCYMPGDSPPAASVRSLLKADSPIAAAVFSGIMVLRKPPRYLTHLEGCVKISAPGAAIVETVAHPERFFPVPRLKGD